MGVCHLAARKMTTGGNAEAFHPGGNKGSKCQNPLITIITIPYYDLVCILAVIVP